MVYDSSASLLVTFRMRSSIGIIMLAGIYYQGNDYYG